MIEMGSMVIYLYGVAVALAAAAGVLMLLRETRGTKIDAVTLALCTAGDNIFAIVVGVKKLYGRTIALRQFGENLINDLANIEALGI